VTDANLVLGRLDPSSPLADGIMLDRHAAAEALDAQVGAPLRLSRHRAALGVVRIAEVKMAGAIRRMTVEQGLDPRDFVLVTFGGAGPMHGASIAGELGIPTVVIPASPGTFSAWGMLNADIRHDTVRTVDSAGASLTREELRERFRVLEAEAEGFFAREGVGHVTMSFVRSIDARYRGQEHTLNAPFPGGPVDDRALEQFVAGFHGLHERKYAHSNPAAPVEIIHVRVAGIGHLTRHRAAAPAAANDAAPIVARPSVTRAVVFGDRAVDVPVYQRADLPPGLALVGPVVVVEYGCTTIVPPRCHVRVDGGSNLIISVPPPPEGGET